MIERIIMIYLDGRIEITNPLRLFGQENMVQSSFKTGDWKHEFYLSKNIGKTAIYRETKGG